MNYGKEVLQYYVLKHSIVNRDYLNVVIDMITMLHIALSHKGQGEGDVGGCFLVLRGYRCLLLLYLIVLLEAKFNL